MTLLPTPPPPEGAGGPVFAYDANGNIQKYLRNSIKPNQVKMDSLTYSYYPNTNQLRRIKDSVPANAFTDSENQIVDIDSQPDSNYVYDAIGNLIKDSAEKITSIKWNVYGKIEEINRIATDTVPASNIKYTYDAMGNRISQVVTSNGTKYYTWYVRDAQGNILSTYTAQGNASLESLELQLADRFMYGSSRLGTITINDNNVDGGPGNTEYYYEDKKIAYDRGYKSYELTNHLGNVLATVSDRKFGVSSGGSSLISYYNPHIVTAQDYYPFGMVSRVNLNGKSYRFGFNGQEMNNDVKGGLGNSYTAQFWEYDSRIGRRWNLDPKPVVGVSEYVAFSNNPIWYNDIKGDTMFRPSWMKYTFENPMKMVLYMTPLGKKLLDEFSKSSSDNIYFYAFDLDKSSRNFKDDNQAVMTTMTNLNLQQNVVEGGLLAINNVSPKDREKIQNKLKHVNVSGFNFNTSATISIIGLNTTDDEYVKYDKYDLAFAIYHEVAAHVKLAKSRETESKQHAAFGNYYYTAGMGLYNSNITGGTLMIQGSEAWKVFKQILELKIKNGDGTKSNEADLKRMNQADAAATKVAADAKKEKSKKK